VAFGSWEGKSRNGAASTRRANSIPWYKMVEVRSVLDIPVWFTIYILREV
jgi:hypothetical protein